jgi:phosphonate transport system substrate-binding protein
LDRLRVVETLGPSPIPPLVVSRAVAAPQRAALATAVLAMHHDPLGAKVLASAAIARFEPVTDADYEPIRHMARVAQQLEPWVGALELTGSPG